jgi:hypothetical protein
MLVLFCEYSGIGMPESNIAQGQACEMQDLGLVWIGWDAIIITKQAHQQNTHRP